MAERLEPTGEYAEPTTKYPWDEWLDGKPWRIKPKDDRGGDFTADIATMRTYIYAQARKRGLKAALTVEVAPEAIVFQAYRPGERRPDLPSTNRRHANGLPDRSAPLRAPERMGPRHTCTICGEGIPAWQAEQGGVCRSAIDLAWRCTDGTPKPRPRLARG